MSHSGIVGGRLVELWILFNVVIHMLRRCAFQIPPGWRRVMVSMCICSTKTSSCVSRGSVYLLTCRLIAKRLGSVSNIFGHVLMMLRRRRSSRSFPPTLLYILSSSNYGSGRIVLTVGHLPRGLLFIRDSGCCYELANFIKLRYGIRYTHVCRFCLNAFSESGVCAS